MVQGLQMESHQTTGLQEVETKVAETKVVETKTSHPDQTLIDLLAR
jgi:hypothetical protein